MNKFFLISVIILIFSCKTRRDTTCLKKDTVLTDTIFNSSSILTTLSYDLKSCKIKKINLYTQIDERSGNYETINDITCKIGVFKDTLFNMVVNTKDIEINKINGKNIVSFSKNFEKPFLDSINFIDLKTICLIKKKNGEKKILKSKSYFYNNTADLLGIEKSYLNYDAFKDRQVRFEILGKSKKHIDSVEFTVKVLNQNIDQIVNYKINLNEKHFGFKYSIKASFKDVISQDNDVRIYDVRKMNTEFLKFKLDMSSAKISQLNAFKLILNGREVR